MPADAGTELVFVGRVGRPHGVDGAFVVEAASEDEDRFAPGACLLVEGSEATVVLSRRVGAGRRAIKLDRSVDRGTDLHVRRSALPALPEGSFYVADLVGLTVRDEHGTSIGTVRDVIPGPANDVLELDSGLLLPLVEACVRDIDLDARVVVLNPGFTE